MDLCENEFLIGKGVSQGKSVSNKYNVDSILQRVYGDVKETDETAGPGRLYAE